jgi:hypothetical protein
VTGEANRGIRQLRVILSLVDDVASWFVQLIRFLTGSALDDAHRGKDEARWCGLARQERTGLDPEKARQGDDLVPRQRPRAVQDVRDRRLRNPHLCFQLLLGESMRSHQLAQHVGLADRPSWLVLALVDVDEVGRRVLFALRLSLTVIANSRSDDYNLAIELPDPRDPMRNLGWTCPN